MFVRKSCSRDKSAGALSHSFFFLYMLVWTSGATIMNLTTKLRTHRLMLFFSPISYIVRHRRYMINHVSVYTRVFKLYNILVSETKENCLHGFLILALSPNSSNESTKGCGSLAKYTIFDPPNLVRRTSALITTTKIMYEIGLSPEQLSV